jgi:ketosteroid isomerase-like protein
MVPSGSSSADVEWAAKRARILELTARYNHAFDGGDVDAYVATFTPDGVMEIDGGPRYEGSAALAEMCANTPAGTIMHVTVNPVVTVDGDRAHQEVTLLVVGMPRQPGEPSRLQRSGRYSDDLVRTEQGWRFTRRRVQLHGGM